jgi:hypothetical protein
MASKRALLEAAMGGGEEEEDESSRGLRREGEFDSTATGCMER